MATTTMPRRTFNPAPIFAFIVFATIAAGVMLGTHALTHSTAEAVRNCNSDKITLGCVYTIPQPKEPLRYASLAQDSGAHDYRD